ncbi:MAG TPA: extracellular solute-binding protein [Roseiflexaceae bacterium]|nr:extracellular solute-binding protein [Roseiflexaceae bacterium]
MTAPNTLRGITWNHTRGYVPLVATAQRFSELHPGVTIEWRTRSLQEFADYPIERLAEQFDMIIIDHPFVGYAAAHPVLLPLDEHLPAAFLDDQAANSVGVSHASYSFGGHQWALAVDAATPVSAHRPDLLERHGVKVPQTWDDLLALARRGMVAVPAIPIDSLMNFYMLCIGLGEEPFADQTHVVSEAIGVAALEHVRELVSLCAPACLERNPIATYEALVSGDDLVYCPFAYGYSNYARADYTAKTLRFGGLVQFNGRALRSTLGGTGLAISTSCQNVELAVAYAQFVASPASQRGMYVTSGGQPGYRAAWLDENVNQMCNNFFRDTLPTLDDAYLRPRYAGYIPFQDHAGPVVHRYLRAGGDPRAALRELDKLYHESLERRNQHEHV